MSDRRAVIRLVVRDGLLLAAGSLVTVVALRWVGVGVSVVVVAAVLTAVRLLVLSVTEARAVPARVAVVRRPDDAEHDYDYSFDEGDLLRSAVRRWEQRLEWSDGDPDQFARIVRPVLTELVDERLRARHGVTLASNPARAREVLAPPLWQLLSDPQAPTPRMQDWPAYVRALQRL
jgi:hypothetical protein